MTIIIIEKNLYSLLSHAIISKAFEPVSDVLHGLKILANDFKVPRGERCRSNWGPFTNYVDKISEIFDPLPTIVDKFVNITLAYVLSFIFGYNTPPLCLTTWFVNDPMGAVRPVGKIYTPILRFCFLKNSCQLLKVGPVSNEREDIKEF